MLQGRESFIQVTMHLVESGEPLQRRVRDGTLGDTEAPASGWMSTTALMPGCPKTGTEGQGDRGLGERAAPREGGLE